MALLLGTLAPETAEAVLARLSSAHAEKVRTRLKALPPAPADAMAQSLQEFFDVLRIAERPVPSAPEAVQPPPAGGPPLPETPPGEPAGRDEAMTANSVAPGLERAEATDPAQALAEFSAETLAAALRGERASTVVLVVGALAVPQATALLKLMPAEVRQDVAVRLGQPSALKPELINRILGSVVARCREVALQPAQPSGDQMLLRLADLVRALGREDRKEILARLERNDPVMAEKVRKKLYTFEDLLRVDDRTLQSILGELATQTLALAMKGGTEEIKTKILNNVSRRARDTIAEEMELLASAPASQIEDAQQQVVKILQRLDEEGSLSL